jgi:aminoglycoside/choline kinase family phosphotransferase
MISPPVIQQFQELNTQSRNSFYRMTLNSAEGKGIETIIAKCYRKKDDNFFGACYRRENGVLAILNDINAPVPKIRGGYLGATEAVLFLNDVGDTNLATKLKSIPENNRSAKLDLLRSALSTLIELHAATINSENKLEHEVSKVVKEVLTPDYYQNAIKIALTRIVSLNKLTRPAQISATIESLNLLHMLMPPITSRLLGEPRTFIHFEFTPGNILLKDDTMTIVDFEQSTIGPAVFDVATLLYNPEANLKPDEIQTLLLEYNSSLPQLNRLDLLVRESALEAAAVIKLLIYAGSAVNFYHKFHDGSRLQAKEWYLTAAMEMMANSENQIFSQQFTGLIAKILGKEEYIK